MSLCSKLRAHCVVVEPSRLDFGAQLICGLLGRLRGSVRAGLAPRPARVRRGEHACVSRDLAAGQAARITGPIESLADLHRDSAERRQRGRIMQDPLGQIRMQADSFPLACAV